MSPQQIVKDWLLRKKAEAAAKKDQQPDPEKFLDSVGLKIPQRNLIGPERAQSELCVAEASASTIWVQVTETKRARALQPVTLFLWLTKIALFLFEVGTITYIFVIELGYQLFTAASTAVLFTTGTFYVTKTLHQHLGKPRSEWPWYVPLLMTIFLITGASLIVLRLANRGTADGASLPVDIASALILAFVTLLPGWPAARCDEQLKKTHELDSTGETLTTEYHETELRIAALREGFDAKSPEDFRLIDQREQLRAIYEQHHRRTENRQLIEGGQG